MAGVRFLLMELACVLCGAVDVDCDGPIIGWDAVPLEAELTAPLCTSAGRSPESKKTTPITAASALIVRRTPRT